MASNTAFVKAILMRIEEQFAKLSFSKKRGVFVRELGKDSFGYVGLNIATHLPQKRIGIAPIVGVIYRPAEELVKKLCGRFLSRYELTLTIAVGYLTPEARFLQWVFDPTMPEIVDSEITKIVRCIKEYGLPFMQEHTTLDSITAELEAKRYTFNEVRRYRLPVAYLLAGRRDEALKFIEQEMESMKESTDAASADYRGFAQAVRAYNHGKRPAD